MKLTPRQSALVIEHKAKVPMRSADREWSPRFSAGLFQFDWEAGEKLAELRRGNNVMRFRVKTYAVTQPVKKRPARKARKR